MGKARQPVLEARSSRAGSYRSQPSGYRAFHPALLPPDPALRLGGDLQMLLTQADRTLGRLAGSLETLPNPDLFVFIDVRKQAPPAACHRLRRNCPLRWRPWSACCMRRTICRR
jgi:hypothetical protein